MPDTLPVHLNRETLHSLEVPTALDTDGSFDVLLINHGEAVHTHLHLGDSLSKLASIEASNHYVPAESTRPVRVTVDQSVALDGKLKVVSGYGATTRIVDINLDEDDVQDGTVTVDDSLAKPQPKESNVSEENSRIDRIELPIFALALAALILAILVWIAVPKPVVRAGSVIVFIAVLAGVYFWYSG